MKVKSRDLQDLLRFLIEIVSSTFKDGTDVYAGRSAFPSFPGCGGPLDVFIVIFALYLSDKSLTDQDRTKLMRYLIS